MKKPSIDKWLEEARSNPAYDKCGMFLFHNGTVRATPKSAVRPETEVVPNPHLTDDSKGDCAAAGSSVSSCPQVKGMHFSYNEEKVEAALSKALALPGIFFAKAWLNEGYLEVGDDIMLVMVGGDIRPRVMSALDSLVDDLKHKCISENEVYKQTITDQQSQTEVSDDL